MTTTSPESLAGCESLFYSPCVLPLCTPFEYSLRTALCRSSGKIETRSSSLGTATTSELSTNTTQLTTFCPCFSHHIFASVIFKLPKTFVGNPRRSQEKPETHHNSPQIPKTSFIHSKVVQPLLLTSSSSRRPPKPKVAMNFR
jgi:hypothetical protein